MRDKTIIKFTGRHRKELIDPVYAEEIQNLISDLKLPEQTKEILRRDIYKDTVTRTNWMFVMLSPQQFETVSHWLDTNSKRPRKAVLLWNSIFSAMRNDTGEILITRDQLAEKINCSPRHVSQIMSELVSINAISRRRVRIAGVRGPGRVHYFMNPNVATTISGNAGRQEAQEKAGQLSIFDVIDGGKNDA